MSTLAPESGDTDPDALVAYAQPLEPSEDTIERNSRRPPARLSGVVQEVHIKERFTVVLFNSPQLRTYLGRTGTVIVQLSCECKEN